MEKTVTGRWRKQWPRDGTNSDQEMEETWTGGWMRHWLGDGRNSDCEMEETLTGRWKKPWLGDRRYIEWEMKETVTGRWKKAWLGAAKFVNIIFLLFHSFVVEFTAVNVISVCNKVEPNINIGLRYFTLVWGTWETPTRCRLFLIIYVT